MDTGMKMEAQIEKNMKGVGVGVGGGGSAEAAAGGGASAVVRWERFLPKTVLRVLLVEADDSTRQIITALLRKCSYRVASVSDGLKAWEILKRRPHNIDLILTEEELPSISGFALLTLIMEHEICKNIPVIMMSSQDSVSTVYKCMLRGATDFLMKPVRINELRNLWQHVWRKQASTGGRLRTRVESVAQDKFESTAENNAGINPARGYMVCVDRNQECVEKESDAESSCAKPEMDTEEADIECVQSLSQRHWSKSLSDDAVMQQKEAISGSKDFGVQEADGAGFQTSGGVDCETMTQREDMRIDDHCQHGESSAQTRDSNHILADSCREAMDLLGAFDLKCTNGGYGSKVSANKIDSSALFELSLRRSQPSGPVNQGTDERRKLNHSAASPFSRYVSRANQHQQSSPSICNQHKSYETSCDKQLSNQTLHYNSDARPSPGSFQRHVPQATGQSDQAEISFTFLQQRALPSKIPVKGVMFGSLNDACCPLTPPVFLMQSAQSSAQHPGSVGQEEASFPASTFHSLNQQARNSQQYNGLADHLTDDAIKQIEWREENKLEKLENRAYFSSATDQSADSSCCNGNISQLHNNGYENNFGMNPVVRVISERRKEAAFPTHDGNLNPSTKREAALTKFRLKRKERCYGKKVRYESRKKLAEQRPRVKGQFVRHTHEPSPGSS